MARRIELNTLLHDFCDNVYFQPPESVKMRYPCIVYQLDKIDTRFANNRPYHVDDRYQITYITKDPDDENIHRIAEELPMCSFGKFFVVDNLNHYTYQLYY